VTTLASDLTALLSNMATVSGASDFTVLQSDITAEKSDTVIFIQRHRRPQERRDFGDERHGDLQGQPDQDAQGDQ
jgi:hypothetical protein